MMVNLDTYSKTDLILTTCGLIFLMRADLDHEGGLAIEDGLRS
jgi:hypothetical protein